MNTVLIPVIRTFYLVDINFTLKKMSIQTYVPTKYNIYNKKCQIKNPLIS